MSVLKGHSCDLCYPASNSLPVGLHSTALQLDGLVINIFMAFWGLFPLPARFLFTVDLLPFQRRIWGRSQTEVRHGYLGGRVDVGMGVRAREDTWSAATFHVTREQISWRILFCTWEVTLFFYQTFHCRGNLLYLKYKFTLYFKLSLKYNLLKYKSHLKHPHRNIQNNVWPHTWTRWLRKWLKMNHHSILCSNRHDRYTQPNWGSLASLSLIKSGSQLFMLLLREHIFWKTKIKTLYIDNIWVNFRNINYSSTVVFISADSLVDKYYSLSQEMDFNGEVDIWTRSCGRLQS